MTTYVVGDIQACLNGLLRLLEKANFCPKNDKLVAVGDLIGRGPDALTTVEFLVSLGDSFDTVLGNHDLHFLAIYAGIRQAKVDDRFDKLLGSPEIKQYVHWLKKKPLALKLDKHTLVSHAGLYPSWSYKQAIGFSQEVSSLLQSSDWKTFLKNMYGAMPNKWNNNLRGYDRTRFIVNAFTRMRYIEGKQQLNFSCKSSPQDAPKNLTPWFRLDNPQLKANQRILFGHWAALQGKTQSTQFVGLDTGYLWGQSMTLLKLENMEKISVNYQEK